MDTAIEEIKQAIAALIEKQKSLHINDPAVYQVWEQMTEILSKDMPLTITYIKGLSAEEFSWVNQVLADIMEKTNSKAYHLFLQSLQAKHPNHPMIEAALNYYIE